MDEGRRALARALTPFLADFRRRAVARLRARKMAKGDRPIVELAFHGYYPDREAMLETLRARAYPTTVGIHEIHATQPDVFDDKVEEYRGKIRRGEDMVPILITADMGGYAVLDGHHRATATVLEGGTQLDALVVPTPGFQKLAKAGGDDGDFDLDMLADIARTAAKIFGEVAQDSGARVSVELGTGDDLNLVNQVDERSLAYAERRGAEMVGRRWVDGELVANPRAEWAITDTLRDALRDIVAAGLRDNLGADEVADRVEAADDAFGPDRADMIARTELAAANSQGSLESYRAAESIGLRVTKAWLPDAEACPICEANGDDGFIGLDEEFSSGDDAPPAHPFCECDIIPGVEDDGEQREDNNQEEE